MAFNKNMYVSEFSKLIFIEGNPSFACDLHLKLLFVFFLLDFKINPFFVSSLFLKHFPFLSPFATPYNDYLQLYTLRRYPGGAPPPTRSHNIYLQPNLPSSIDRLIK